MRKKTFLLLGAGFLFLQVYVHAQDNSKPGAIKNIQSTSQQTDKLCGKNIQQQSLTNHHIESLSVPAVNSFKKPPVKSRTKHS